MTYQQIHLIPSNYQNNRSSIKRSREMAQDLSLVCDLAPFMGLNEAIDKIINTYINHSAERLIRILFEYPAELHKLGPSISINHLMLVAKSFDCSLRDKDAFVAFDLEYDDVMALKLLILKLINQSGFDLRKSSNCLVNACKNGYVDVVRYLVHEIGVDINQNNHLAFKWTKSNGLTWINNKTIFRNKDYQTIYEILTENLEDPETIEPLNGADNRAQLISRSKLETKHDTYDSSQIIQLLTGLFIQPEPKIHVIVLDYLKSHGSKLLKRAFEFPVSFHLDMADRKEFKMNKKHRDRQFEFRQKDAMHFKLRGNVLDENRAILILFLYTKPEIEIINKLTVLCARHGYLEHLKILLKSKPNLHYRYKKQTALEAAKRFKFFDCCDSINTLINQTNQLLINAIISQDLKQVQDHIKNSSNFISIHLNRNQILTVAYTYAYLTQMSNQSLEIIRELDKLEPNKLEALAGYYDWIAMVNPYPSI